MLKIGIFPNTKKNNIQEILDWIIRYCGERQATVMLPEGIAGPMGYPELRCSRDAMQSEMTFGITLGGDGTLLNTAREVAAAGVPLCGVNMGQLGFLTEIELSALSCSLEKLLTGDYYIEERLMLQAAVVRQGQEMHKSTALNDIVISKGSLARIVRLNLFIDDVLTENYRADGLIISTATGSTGYSLSAGGPIINPNLKVMVLTPICPHMLHARSLVISEDEQITVTMQPTQDEVMLTADGQILYHLSSQDIIQVKRLPYRAKFIKLNGGNSYYDTLRTKLRRGDK